MKKIILLVIFFFPLLFLQKTFAQDKFHIGFNGGYVLQGPSKGLFDGGKNAWTIMLNASYSISSIFKLGLQTGYLNFPNYKIYSSGIVPDQSNVVLPPGSYDYSTIENTSAKVYQVALGVTYVNTSSQKIRPVLSVYTGIYFFRYVNNVSLYWTNENHLDFVLPYNSNYSSFTRGFASIAFGYQFPITNSFDLSLQAVYTFTFDRSNKTQDFIPVLCGIEYSL